ncbi:MAG: gfo/Idh/MocA family oxidoreductase, partial [Cyclobacteriaceae bacterium]|nr:gfo/Idh/MocA family oxidoreductase [Cyclobacteriaceae bacterium]
WNGPAPERGYNPELSPHISNDIFPHWRNYAEYGGGMVTDWGAHMFDIAQWGLGMDRSGPVSFVPPGGNDPKEGMKFYYENGVEMIHQDFGRGNAVRFIGTEGTIDISRSFLESTPENIVQAEIKSSDKRLYNSRDHYGDWLNAIRNRTQPICDVETGHRSASVGNLANIAYKLKRKLTWDPVKEKFKKDQGANQLLGKVMRAPWSLKV